MLSPLQLQQCSLGAGFSGAGLRPQQGLGELMEMERSIATRWTPGRNVHLMDFACRGLGPEVKPRELQKEESKLQIHSGLSLAQCCLLKRQD